MAQNSGHITRKYGFDSRAEYQFNSMNNLKDAYSLKCNGNWLPLCVESPETIFIDMAKDTVRGVNIEYAIKDGIKDYSDPIIVSPLKWEEWIELPIRNGDRSIRTPHREIRIPTVVVCSKYRSIPMKKFKCTAKNIYARDAGVDQYTGKKLGPGEWNVDHVIPRSRGGKTTWENVVICSRKINSDKGNSLNEEIGLKLIRQPKEPKPMVGILSGQREVLSHDWNLFFIK